MNLPLAFLHGEQVLVGLALAVLMALVGVPLVLYVWLWHTKVSEFKLAVGYLILMAVLSAVFGLAPFNPTSILYLTVSMLGLLLTLPWNVLASWVLSKALNTEIGDDGFAVLMMLAAGINAVLLFFAARKMRRLIK